MARKAFHLKHSLQVVRCWVQLNFCILLINICTVICPSRMVHAIYILQGVWCSSQLLACVEDFLKFKAGFSCFSWEFSFCSYLILLIFTSISSSRLLLFFAKCETFDKTRPRPVLLRFYSPLMMDYFAPFSPKFIWWRAKRCKKVFLLNFNWN